MGNRSRAGSNQRLGLVDVEVGPGMVYMTVYPPGARSATVEMKPDDARALCGGIQEAADLAELPEGKRDEPDRA